MDYTSKLARQIALKKKLEEEFKRTTNVSGNKDADSEEGKQGELDGENRIEMVREVKMEEAYPKKKDIWLNKREEFKVRA